MKQLLILSPRAFILAGTCHFGTLSTKPRWTFYITGTERLNKYKNQQDIINTRVFYSTYNKKYITKPTHRSVIYFKIIFTLHTQQQQSTTRTETHRFCTRQVAFTSRLDKEVDVLEQSYNMIIQHVTKEYNL